MKFLSLTIVALSLFSNISFAETKPELLRSSNGRAAKILPSQVISSQTLNENKVVGTSLRLIVTQASMTGTGVDMTYTLRLAFRQAGEMRATEANFILDRVIEVKKVTPLLNMKSEIEAVTLSKEGTIVTRTYQIDATQVLVDSDNAIRKAGEFSKTMLNTTIEVKTTNNEPGEY